MGDWGKKDNNSNENKADNNTNSKKEKESTLPTFILKRIFPKNCAQIRKAGGFILKLINRIEPFKFITPRLESQLDPFELKLDDKILDSRNIYFRVNDRETSYMDFHKFNGGVVKLNDEIEIIYKSDEKFEPGIHILDLYIDAPQPIRIKFKTKFLADKEY